MSEENTVLQQYIGLKDSAGTEIYEGDIVQSFSKDIINDNFRAEVIFDEGSFLFKINKKDIRMCFGGNDVLVVSHVFEEKN